MIAALLVWGGASAAFASGFVDVTSEVGIDYVQWRKDVAFGPDESPMTGGAAAGDFDNDGWVDLFVTRLDDSDLLLRNVGGRFVDVSASAGIGSRLPTNGAAWGDIDNDGDLDLYVTTINTGQNLLYVNDGAGGFTEQGVARQANVPGRRHNAFSATFGDYDRDGYLDLHTTEWTENPVSAARLLRNRGADAPGQFGDVTSQAGLELTRGYSFTSTFTDMDQDGWPDLVVASDFGNSRLFWNNGDGTFVDGTEAAGVGTDENGMGSAVGDFDGDGDFDWFVTSIFDPRSSCVLFDCNWGYTGNRLYENAGDRTFVDSTDAAGVRDGGWGWGTTFFDYDHDGDLDLIMTNGIELPGEPDFPYNFDVMRLWRNDDGAYTDVTAEMGVDDTGQGKALVTLDYDNDGDLDVFVVNNGAGPILYRNDATEGRDWLIVELVGTQSNRDGVGARVSVIDGAGAAMVRELGGASNYLGHNELIAHFGLGDSSLADHAVEIVWPSGVVQRFDNVAANQVLRAVEPIPEPAAAVLTVGALLAAALGVRSRGAVTASTRP